MAKTKVRMLVALAGMNFVANVGDVYECDSAEAKRLLASGAAEPVKKAPARTARAAGEKAVSRGKARRAAK